MFIRIGRQIGPYYLLRELAVGGMGTVYLARQDPFNRLVVLKASNSDHGCATGMAQPVVESRFRAEAEVHSTLIHPHILPLLDFHIDDGIAYLVTPYVPLGSLSHFLDVVISRSERRWLAPWQAATIVAQAAAALQYAHDRGILHCDVKPGNILIHLLEPTHLPPASVPPFPSHSVLAAPVTDGAYLYVQLADFGLAHAVFDREPDVVASTPAYAAPEVAVGLPLPATDQYALACVAYFLLTGRHVFDGSRAQLEAHHRATPPPLASAFDPALPSAADAVLAKALAKEPAERYARVWDFAQALNTALFTPH